MVNSVENNRPIVIVEYNSDSIQLVLCKHHLSNFEVRSHFQSFLQFNLPSTLY